MLSHSGNGHTTSVSDLKFWQAELVAMFFRLLPEDVTVHNEDLDGNELSFNLVDNLPG